jgi:hypothetical protein
MPPAFVYGGDKIDMSGNLPGLLPPDFNDLTPEEQEEYRLHLILANRHKYYEGGKSATTPRRLAAYRLPHVNQIEDAP